MKRIPAMLLAAALMATPAMAYDDDSGEDSAYGRTAGTGATTVPAGTVRANTSSSAGGIIVPLIALLLLAAAAASAAD
jgi:hypothetical protein